MPSFHLRAQSERAIIVTNDEDFAFLSTTMQGARVLWVRTGNVVNRVLLARFEHAWLRIVAHLEEGAHIVELR